jgi:hypothetical protein
LKRTLAEQDVDEALMETCALDILNARTFFGDSPRYPQRFWQVEKQPNERQPLGCQTVRWSLDGDHCVYEVRQALRINAELREDAHVSVVC